MSDTLLPSEARRLAALRAALSPGERATLRSAFATHLWPGPWDGGEVHDHQPPFCFTRNPQRDCTPRVMELFRAGHSFSHVAFLSGLSRTAFRDALARHGVPLSSIKRGKNALSEEQIAAIRALWSTGWSAKEIATIVEAETGFILSTSTIYACTPPRPSNEYLPYRVTLHLDYAQDLLDMARALQTTPNRIVQQLVIRGLRSWRAKTKKGG